MNEQLNRVPEPNDAQQAQIDHLVDTQGMSYAEAAEHVLEGATPSVTREESRRAHPSNYIPKKTPRRHGPLYDGDTFDTVDTSNLTAEELEAKRMGIAAVREALRRSRQVTSSPGEYNQYLLERKAAEDRQQRSQ